MIYYSLQTVLTFAGTSSIVIHVNTVGQKLLASAAVSHWTARLISHHNM